MTNANDMMCVMGIGDAKLLLLCAMIVLVVYGVMFFISFATETNKRIELMLKETNTSSPERDCESAEEGEIV